MTESGKEDESPVFGVPLNENTQYIVPKIKDSAYENIHTDDNPISNNI